MTIRAIPDEVLALPCDTCGGPGWFFDDVYGLGACATCIFACAGPWCIRLTACLRRTGSLRPAPRW